ncbi:MAG: hypothetical protein CVU38_05785 [Chloroflexi bacterium HGW-Chloroflexi-1]|nr:MAG: hypothetical protein CVU38_05785 [Chloroflexi bacterium HGW-Chloroflexi-1]
MVTGRLVAGRLVAVDWQSMNRWSPYQFTNQATTNSPTYQSTNLPIYQSTNLPIYQFTNLPIYQSTNLPIYQSTNLPIYQPCHHFSKPSRCTRPFRTLTARPC